MVLKKHVSEWISLGFQFTISMCPLWDYSQEVVSKYGEIGDGAGGSDGKTSIMRPCTMLNVSNSNKEL